MDARIIEQAGMMLEDDNKTSEVKLTEEKTTSQASPQINQRNINEALRKLIGSAILGEDYSIAVNGNNNPQDNVPQKIKDALSLVRTMQNLLYSIQDSYCSYDQTDSVIKNMIAENNAKTITECLKKFNEIWMPSEEKKESKIEEPHEEKKENSEEKEEKKEEPSDIMSQIMQIIKKNEEIESPQGDKFIVEDVIKNKAYVKNVITNKKFTIEAETLLKWKNGVK